MLRFAGVLAIAVWLGGLVALGGVAAPAIFAAVAAGQLADGRALSGAIFGEVLRRFHLVAYACAAVVLLSLIARRVLGPPPRRFGVRFAVGTLMIAATVYSGMVILPTIAEVRQTIGAGVSVAGLPETDPRRTEFERLHQRSGLLQLIVLAGACTLLFLELSDSQWTGHEPSPHW